MAIPRQVKKQIEEVEEIEKQLKAQEKPKPETDSEDSQEVEAKENLDTTDEVPNETSSEVEKSGAEEPTDEPQVEADDFKQKYNTLQGKYNAEVPKLHQQLRQLTEKLNAFEQAQEEKQKTESAKPRERVSYVTDADREEFGEELIDVQRRVAREVAQDYEERFEKQEAIIKALQKKLDNTGAQVGEMSFSQKLQVLVPDFAQIDNDPKWVEWLNEYDPMVRGQRREIAQAAFNNGDAEAVADYVKLFKQQMSGGEPVNNRQAELEKQVAPNRSVTNGKKSASREARLYTQKEMDNQWNKIRTLSSRGKYDEAEKLEAELTSAYLEGRVRA